MNSVKDKIIALQKEGKTKEQIYAQLIIDGYLVDMINVAYTALSPTASAVAATAKTATGDHKEKATNMILVIGSVLVAAGIFSFIATNWQEMTDTVKVVLILAGVIIFNTSGWYMRNRTSLKKTGEALLLLGSLTYGGGIFLVAQIFNIRAEWPDGFMLWTLGALLFAYIVHSWPLYILTFLVALSGIFGYIGIFAGGWFRDSLFINTHYLSDAILYVTAFTLCLAGTLMLRKTDITSREYY